MQATDLPLKDIHLPDAISWWPPAIGWWLLALLAPTVIALGYWLYKYLTRKTAVKAAKKILAGLKRDNTLDAQQKLTQLSVLIRRVAISIAVDEAVAGLTGQAWLEFLDRAVKGKPFTQGIGQLLADAPYRRSPPTEAEMLQLIELCGIWLKTCVKSVPTKSTS